MKTKLNFQHTVPRLIHALNIFNQYPALYGNKLILNHAVRRYEQLWIPLIANTHEKVRLQLVPPVDVEWIWFCHMLAPQHYEKDMKAILRSHNLKQTFIDHALLDTEDRSRGSELAENEWNKLYPAQPFDISTSIANAEIDKDVIDTHTSSTLYQQVSSYNIIESATRQMSFHYQVAILPHYSNKMFITHARRRYIGGSKLNFILSKFNKKRNSSFLELKRRFPSTILAPTFDIDVCWHTHMLHPKLYRDETQVIFGRLLPHDDSFVDRSEGGNLNIIWKETQKLWKQEFGEDGPNKPGCMWRGNVSLQEIVVGRILDEEIRNQLNQMKTAGHRKFKWSITENFLDKHLCSQKNSIPWIHEQMIQWNHECASNRKEEVFSKFETIDGETACYGRVMHIMREKCNKLETAIEVYQPRVENGKKAQWLPHATAHQIGCSQLPLPSSFDLSKLIYLKRGEKAFLIRVGCKDFAVVSGRWTDFKKPETGNSLVLGNPGSPGALQIRCILLEEDNKFQNVTVLRFGPNKRSGRYPGRYKVFVGENKNDLIGGELVVDLSSASFEARTSLTKQGFCASPISCVIGLAISCLHVMLQPMFRPPGSGDDSVPFHEKSFCPPWSVRQYKYPILSAVGGEMEIDGKLSKKYANMKYLLYLQNVFVAETEFCLRIGQHNAKPKEVCDVDKSDVYYRYLWGGSNCSENGFDLDAYIDAGGGGGGCGGMPGFDIGHGGKYGAGYGDGFRYNYLRYGAGGYGGGGFDGGGGCGSC